jgi:hypothetical protein
MPEVVPCAEFDPQLYIYICNLFSSFMNGPFLAVLCGYAFVVVLYDTAFEFRSHTTATYTSSD